MIGDGSARGWRSTRMKEHEDGGTRFLSPTFRETRYGLGCQLRMLLAVLDHGSGRETQPKSFQDWHRRITAQLCCASVAPFVSCMPEETKNRSKNQGLGSVRYVWLAGQDSRCGSCDPSLHFPRRTQG